jgi:hypothetical protein
VSEGVPVRPSTVKVMWGGPGDATPAWEVAGDDPVEEARAAFRSDVRHSRIARQMLGLRRYAVNRRPAAQPSFVDPARVPPRIAELWWDSVEAVEECFNSPSGLADLGDAAVHLPPVPINFPERFSGPNITFLRELPLPVAQPLGLDVHSGGYLGSGLMTKLLGFVRTGDPAAFDGWYVDAAPELVRPLPGVRAHVLETTLEASIHIGNVTRGEQPAADRVIDLWFPDVTAIERDGVTPAGSRYLEEVASHCDGVEWVAMRNQEIFFSYELVEELYLDPHLDPHHREVPTHAHS